MATTTMWFLFFFAVTPDGVPVSVPAQEGPVAATDTFENCMKGGAVLAAALQAGREDGALVAPVCIELAEGVAESIY